MRIPSRVFWSAVCAALLTLAAPTRPAWSLPIPDLYPTGVDGTGTPLPVGAADSHYTLSGGGFTSQVVAPFGPVGGPYSWVRPTSGGGQWIGPTAGDAPSGVYVYSLTFDLNGLDPSTAAINGLWSTDNGASIELNGSLVWEMTTAPGERPFNALHAFEITDAFLAGLNVLTFLVTNNPANGPYNPSGMLVSEIAGTAGSNVPEPSTLVLAGLGLAALRGIRTRERQG